MKTDPQARYRETHEWARLEGGLVTFGITDHAQDHLGDVVFVDLPALGTTFAAGQVFGVVESVKAASDLYAPVGGEVVAVNADLTAHPEALNTDPYGAWIVKVKPSSLQELDALMDAETYGRTAG